MATPRSDVCNTCERRREHILNGRQEIEKFTATRNLTYHFEEVDKEYNFYNRCITKARKEHHSLLHPEPDSMPCSSKFTKAHYTLDFAQCCSIPHHSRQVGRYSLRLHRKFRYKESVWKDLDLNTSSSSTRIRQLEKIGRLLMDITQYAVRLRLPIDLIC